MIAIGFAICVAVSLFGVWLTWQAVVGQPTQSKQARSGATVLRAKFGQRPVVYGAAAAIFVVTLFLTKRVVAAGGIAAMAVVIPQMFTAKRARRHQIRRQLACAEFTDMIRRGLAAGGSIGEAIKQAAELPPPEIEQELADYYAEQHTVGGTTRKESLIQLAERVQEPTMDLVVAQLLAADAEGAGDLTKALADISTVAREFASARTKTQTERDGTEFQAQLLGVVCFAVAVFLGTGSKNFAASYDESLTGQLLLLPSIVLFVLGWLGLNRLNRVESQHRFKLARESRIVQ